MFDVRKEVNDNVRKKNYEKLYTLYKRLVMNCYVQTYRSIIIDCYVQEEKNEKLLTLYKRIIINSYVHHIRLY